MSGRAASDRANTKVRGQAARIAREVEPVDLALPVVRPQRAQVAGTLSAVPGVVEPGRGDRDGGAAAERERGRRWSRAELDRVLGGGMIAGCLVLLGGDPGIGKSTLLVQALAGLTGGGSVLYATGE